MDIALNLFYLVAGFVLLIKGADWFVEGTSGIAAKLGIPQIVIGLTIVAMGTSAPEAAVSINASLKGNAGIAIGNVLGSNILNILIILGVILALFVITFAIYWFNLDMKLIRVVYDWLWKNRYDKMKKDKKL